MDIEILKKQLGTRLKALRTEKGLTQEDLEQYGFSYRHYGKIERGEVNLTLKTMLNLCELFEISLSDLLSFMDNEGGGGVSNQREALAVRFQGVLRDGKPEKLHKLRIFLDEIL